MARDIRSFFSIDITYTNSSEPVIFQPALWDNLYGTNNIQDIPPFYIVDEQLDTAKYTAIH